MSYRHKRIPCFRSTSEILAENCLDIKEATYDLTNTPTTGHGCNSTAAEASARFSNVLIVPSSATEEQDALDAPRGENTPGTHVSFDYVIERSTDVRAEDTKERIEKKERRRNYVEFRSDYQRGH